MSTKCNENYLRKKGKLTILEKEKSDTYLIFNGEKCLSKLHLNIYFRLHVYLSFRTSVRSYVTLPFFLIPAVLSHNVTNETYMAYLMSEKYVVWVNLRPLGSMREG